MSVPTAGGSSAPEHLDLTVVDRQGYLGRLGLPNFGPLVESVLAAEGQGGRWAVSVVLTDDAELRGLHRDFMGLDTETDVMTFPLGEEGDAPPPERGGDIVVSVERAEEQAPEHGTSAAGEVRFLVVHGLLHLCGWDDAGEEARRAMLARGERLLAEFDGREPRG